MVHIMRKLSFVIFIFSYLCISPIYSQQDTLIQKLYSFVANVNDFTDYYPQEKVFLHFDNSSYFLGETIWFKCYVNIADVNEATDISRTLYVELLNPEGAVVDTRKLMIENGQCHGEFPLPPLLLYSGFYQVRAYTRYMLNFGDDFIFSRVFPIYDRPEKEGDYSKMKITGSKMPIASKRKNQDKLKDVNIDFFPEGGNLIIGLKSKVAFKVVDKDGIGIDAKGIVYDSNKQPVASFETVHQGMGCFYLEPTSNGYYVEVDYKGKKHKEELPLSLTSGYVMELSQINDEELQIDIRKTLNLVGDTIGVSSSCRGRANSFAVVNMTAVNKAAVKLQLKNMETGVNQITIYDREGRILCDRLIFVNHNDKQLKVTKTQNKEVYSPMEKINMEFAFNDILGNPVETSFSLSVKDAGTSTSTVYNDNVMTNMLLSSDIKGYIEDPSYYFEGKDEKRKSDLDLLLLTQGWRRYVWEQMSGTQDFRFVQEAEKGILIDGTVKAAVRDKVKENVDVAVVLSNDTLGVLHESGKTDNLGRFNIYARDIKGEWDLVLQTKENNKKKDYRILLNRLFSPMPRAYMGFETKMSDKVRERRIIEQEKDGSGSLVKDTVFVMNEKDHLLPTVTITEKRKYNEKAEDLAGSNLQYDVRKEMDSMADAGDYLGDNIVEFLLKTDPNFAVDYFAKASPKAVLTEFDRIAPTYYYSTQPILFIVNNEPLNKSPWVNVEDIPLGRIETIAISDSRSIAMRLTSKGWVDLSVSKLDNLNYDSFDYELEDAYTEELPTLSDPIVKRNKTRDRIYVLLYTYPNEKARADKKSMRHTKLQGYSYTKDFYNPQYNYSVFPDERDYRRTLYWNPDIKTDKAGKAGVSFYNNSTSQQISIDAETITPSGQFGVYEE